MRNIKLIALDLDGTLLNMEKKVPQGNYCLLYTAPSPRDTM